MKAEKSYSFSTTKLAKINTHTGGISHHWRKHEDYLIKILGQVVSY